MPDTSWCLAVSCRITSVQNIPEIIAENSNHPHTGRSSMNIHEYQAKAVLKEFGLAVSRGGAALTVEEAVKAAQELPGPLYVVKSQIHAGGRGKGKFKE